MASSLHPRLNDLFATTDDSLLPNWIDLGDTTASEISAASAAPLTGKEGSVTTGMSLYLTESGDTTPVSVDDIHQGQIGDCFLLSSIGEEVLTDNPGISAMIKANTNGTETVTLYEAKTGSLPTFGTTQFKSVTETVVNNFQSSSVNNAASQDVVGGVKEIWPQVLEQAVAQLNGGYSSIANGGNPVIAMEELTGKTANWYSASSVTLSQLQADVTAKDMIVLDTSAAGNSTYNLVGSHAYMFDGLVVKSGTTYVQALNPWGVDQPGLIPVSALGKAFAEMDVGHV